MNIKQILTFIIKITLIITASYMPFSKASESTFAPELKIFENYLGTWESVFKSENGVPSIVDVSQWQRALNGKALRTLHSINDGEYGGESLIFYDNKEKTLKFYYFTTADFYTKGTIKVVSDNSFVAFEKVTGESAMSKGITEVKSTSTLKDEEILVETSYLKNGSWTKPESRRYKRSDKEVKFK